MKLPGKYIIMLKWERREATGGGSLVVRAAPR